MNTSRDDETASRKKKVSFTDDEAPETKEVSLIVLMPTLCRVTG